MTSRYTHLTLEQLEAEEAALDLALRDARAEKAIFAGEIIIDCEG